MGSFFLINTIDRSVATAKSGRIKVGNSGTVGVGVGFGEEEGVAVGACVGVDV